LQVLQEAKEKDEVESKINNKVDVKKGYAYLLDSYQGKIHLHIFSILSSYINIYLNNLFNFYLFRQLVFKFQIVLKYYTIIL